MFQDHYLESKELDNIHQIRKSQKGLTQCDFGYIALFDYSSNKKDQEKLQKYFKYIKTAREKGDLQLKNELIQYYEQFLARSYQDMSVCYEFIPEPHLVGYKADRVVFSGLERIADLVTGVSNLTFNYYAVGTGSTPVLPADTRLDFEEHRVSIAQTGFAESKGSSMVFAANFPTTMQSMSISESGIFDRFSNGVMLLRTVYEGSNIVPHVFNQTFIATSHFIYQLSV